MRGPVAVSGSSSGSILDEVEREDEEVVRAFAGRALDLRDRPSPARGRWRTTPGEEPAAVGLVCQQLGAALVVEREPRQDRVEAVPVEEDVERGAAARDVDAVPVGVLAAEAQVREVRREAERAGRQRDVLAERPVRRGRLELREVVDAGTHAVAAPLPHGAQVVPHSPQLPVSVVLSTQAPAHASRPPVQATSQLPAWQTAPPAQGMLQPRQWAASTPRRTHAAPQRSSPSTQTQSPPWHVSRAPQTSPHRPQWRPLVSVSTHAPSHSVSPSAQPHVRRRGSGSPSSQAVEQLPQ